MSVQWADNFGRYGTGGASNTAMRDGLPYNNWESTCVADPDPLAPTERCCQIQNGLSNNPLVNSRIALPSPYTGVVGLAARYWLTSLNGGNGRRCIATFTDNSITPYAACIVEANGAVSLVEGIDGAEIASTVAPVISTNSWNHFETTYDAASGDMEVRLNGVTILTGTAAASGGTVFFAMPAERLGTGGPVGALYVKDLVLWDGSGTRNNDFMGTVICRRFKPNADVTLGGWTLSTGASGFALLAKDAVDDTTYAIADDTPPAPMQFGMENLPPDVTSVRAVIPVIRARKIDGGDANLQTALISAGDFDNGADRPITTAFTYYYDVSELSPDTAAPWTPVEFDAMTTQVDRTV